MFAHIILASASTASSKMSEGPPWPQEILAPVFWPPWEMTRLGPLLPHACPAGIGAPLSKACQGRPVVEALQSCASPWHTPQWHWTDPALGWVSACQSTGKRIQPRSIAAALLPKWMGSQVVASGTACKPSWLAHTPVLGLRRVQVHHAPVERLPGTLVGPWSLQELPLQHLLKLYQIQMPQCLCPLRVLHWHSATLHVMQDISIVLHHLQHLSLWSLWVEGVLWRDICPSQLACQGHGCCSIRVKDQSSLFFLTVLRALRPGRSFRWKSLGINHSVEYLSAKLEPVLALHKVRQAGLGMVSWAQWGFCQHPNIHRMPQFEILVRFGWDIAAGRRCIRLGLPISHPSDAIPSHEQQPIASGVVHVDQMLGLLDRENLLSTDTHLLLGGVPLCGPVRKAFRALVCCNRLRLNVLPQVVTTNPWTGAACHVWLLHDLIVDLLRLHCHIGLHHTSKAHSWNALRVAKLDKQVKDLLGAQLVHHQFDVLSHRLHGKGDLCQDEGRGWGAPAKDFPLVCGLLHHHVIHRCRIHRGDRRSGSHALRPGGGFNAIGSRPQPHLFHSCHHRVNGVLQIGSWTLKIYDVLALQKVCSSIVGVFHHLCHHLPILGVQSPCRDIVFLQDGFHMLKRVQAARSQSCWCLHRHRPLSLLRNDAIKAHWCTRHGGSTNRGDR